MSAEYDVRGYALFYLVRADSATTASGGGAAAPDSTRWCVQGFDDESLMGRATGVVPTRQISFLRIKEFYLHPTTEGP